MGPFGLFVVLVAADLLIVLALRILLLWTGRRLQKRIGFSDFALTDMAITLPLIAYVVVFMAGMAWFWS